MTDELADDERKPSLRRAPLERMLSKYPELMPASLSQNSDLPAGWEAIVDTLMNEIPHLLTADRAWSASTAAAATKKTPKPFVVVQLKEEFGAMRLYWSLGGKRDRFVDLIGGSEGIETFRSLAIGPGPMVDIRSLVDAASEASAQTCQVCGAPGTICGREWLRTLCAKHGDEARP